MASFLVLDGPDGGGKSTVGRAVAERLQREGASVTTCTDPGGTAVGDRIRSVLLDHDLTGMDVRCEALLFMASRAQLVAEVVRPAVERGDVVLADRFVSATCAYQVAAGADFDDIIRLARLAIDDAWPCLTVVLDVPPQLGFQRIKRRKPTPSGRTGGSVESSTGLDAMERRSDAFHDRVRANFLSLPDRYPTPVEIVDATQPLDDVIQVVFDRFTAALGRPGR